MTAPTSSARSAPAGYWGGCHHANGQYRVHIAAPGRDQHAGSAGLDRAVICDGAGWLAQWGALTMLGNVVLVPLPAYAPKLNSMENVWGYLRGNKLSAGVWDNYEESVDACAEPWNWLMAGPDRIRSIGTRDWATVNV